MRYVSILTAICAVFVASVMLTATSILSVLDAPSDDIRIVDLESGRLLPMLTGPTLWGQYPRVPNDLSTLLDYYAIAFAVGVAGACILLRKSRLGYSFRAAAVTSLAVGVIPYSIGSIVLRMTSHSPSESGMWISLMVFGVFYCSCVSLIFFFIDFGKGRGRRSQIKNLSSDELSHAPEPPITWHCNGGSAPVAR